MVSPFNSSNTTLVVDVSKWVPGFDVGVLKMGGVRAIVARIGEGLNDKADPTFGPYVQAAYDNDIPAMGYYVIHPEMIDNTKGCVDEHLARIKAFTANKALTAIWIDSEITKDARGLPIAPQWISDRTRSLIDETQRAFPKLKVGLYTGGWYVDAYSPQMKTWMYKYPLWWAYYTITTGGFVEWSDLEKYYPAALPKNIPPGANGKDAAALTLWQWTGDKLKLPGMYSDENKVNRAAADINFFMGNEQALYRWLDYVPRGTQPDPDPEDPTDPQQPPATGDLAALMTELLKIGADVKVIKAFIEDMRKL